MEEKRIMKNFSQEEEETIRKFIFTNPHEDISFVYPQPLIAGEELSPLMSAYSRTHIPMQDRVLKFLDEDKLEQTRAFLSMIPQIIDIFRNPDGTLKMSAKTAIFNKLWPLKHGHTSIKEETALFGHVENIPDITGKKITGHPLIKPQVKSTRYLSYGKTLDKALDDIDIKSLPEPDKYLSHIDWMNKKYLTLTERLADLVYNHSDTNKIVEYLGRIENVNEAIEKRIKEEIEVDENFSPSLKDYQRKRELVIKELEDSNVRKNISKFVLDSSRVYLLAANRTSMGYSVDARTLEEIITDLISSPRKDDQTIGYKIWGEAKKISPVLLGEKSHIKVDEWKIKNERELRAYMQNRFGNISSINEIYESVNILHPSNTIMYTDRFNAALLVFPYVDASLQDILKNLDDKDIKEILKKSHENRSDHDVLHPAIAHGGLMIEIVMGYHGYRDIFRHRRGSRSLQLLTTRLGFENLEIFKEFNLEKEYNEDMKKCSEIYESARKVDQHIAEKLVPFGANCRSLYSWQPNQIGYVGKLRGNISRGNASYVKITREIIKKVSKLMPLTAEYFKIDNKDYPSHLWKAGYEWYDKEARKNEN